MVIALLFVGVIFVICELMTSTVLFIFIGAGFLSAAITLAFFDNLIYAVLVGIIITIVSFLFIRKPMINRLKTKSTLSGSDSIIGKEVIVTKKIIGGSALMGEIILNGVTCNAKSEKDLNVGDVALVVQLKGAHLIIKGDL